MTQLERKRQAKEWMNGLSLLELIGVLALLAVRVIIGVAAERRDSVFLLGVILGVSISTISGTVPLTEAFLSFFIGLWLLTVTPGRWFS